MSLSDKERAFLETHHGAAMITLRPDGTPHAVRVGVALVGDKLWSSGVPSRVRNKYLRRDPRCTLFIYDTAFAFLSVDARATILDGPDAPELNLRLFQIMQAGRPDPNKLGWFGGDKTLEEFLQVMRDEQRLIYEFEPLRTYGMF